MPITGPEARIGAARPVLVGGTGRSGSTIVGHLLDHHPALTLCRPMEVRFIALKHGLADALAVATQAPGSTQAAAAAQTAVSRILKRWFWRAENVGLYQSISRDEIERRTVDYLESFGTDPLVATRGLTYAVMGRIADRLGADRLVDTTPANARRADLLEPIYPQSTVIVVTRDGRDVAASFASQSFGPDDPAAALLQWEDRMLQTHRAVANCRPGRVLTIELRDLVVSDRLGTLRRVCDVVGIDPHPDMMSWFEANVTSSGMHPGRWRGQFDADTCTALDVQYEAVCRRLAAAGVALPS